MVADGSELTDEKCMFNRSMKVTSIQVSKEDLELLKHQDEKVCLHARALLFLTNQRKTIVLGTGTMSSLKWRAAKAGLRARCVQQLS